MLTINYNMAVEYFMKLVKSNSFCFKYNNMLYSCVFVRFLNLTKMLS